MAFRNALFVVSSLAARVLGAALFKEDCATPDPSQEHVAVSKLLFLNESLLDSREMIQEIVRIPVYVHVIAKDETVAGGYTSEGIVKDAIADMNQKYDTMGFQYDLKAIDYTINRDWAVHEDQATMRRTLRKGDYKTLNLYYIPSLGANGYCALPVSTPFRASALSADGCTMRTSTLTNFHTTPHEVGHWLGLYHTFQNGCQGQGDYVDDTPACIQSWGCVESQDTCPDQPGNDPVHNLMGYGNCRTHFTPGQGLRMRTSYEYYRK